MSFSVLAPAKLNLFLNVVGRRDDGYHLLESLFVFPELADRITGVRSETSELGITGEFGTGLSSDADNLVQRACTIMREHSGHQVYFKLTLEKNIPVAAGLGGGSADAAAVLRAINGFCHLGWPISELERLAAMLGADVAACVRSKAIMARGIGEVLTGAPSMPPCGVLLVNPRIPTPTPAVFKAFKAMTPDIPQREFAPLPDRFVDVYALINVIAPRGNDLLAAAISVTPEIKTVLELVETLPGVNHTGLSGSGATCFALFDTEADAAWAQSALIKERPAWWYWSGGWSAGF